MTCAHFMATEMLSVTVPLATVAQRLNDAGISTTVNVHTHAIRAWDRPAAEILSTVLTQPETPRALDLDRPGGAIAYRGASRVRENPPGRPCKAAGSGRRVAFVGAGGERVTQPSIAILPRGGR